MVPFRNVLTVIVCVLAASASASPGASRVPKTNTRAAVQAYVQEAAKVIARSGPDCPTFATPQWRSGDYYIFVDGPDRKTVCHPNAALVGKPSGQVTNSKGEKVGEKIEKASMMSGGGWADYFWPRPGRKDEEAKSTFAMRVKAPDGKEYVVGAGGWNLK